MTSAAYGVKAAFSAMSGETAKKISSMTALLEKFVDIEAREKNVAVGLAPPLFFSLVAVRDICLSKRARCVSSHIYRKRKQLD